MSKRTHSQIRKAILQALSDDKEHAYGDLERKVNTNWQTVRNHCDDLVIFSAVSITSDKVRITKEGRELLRRIS